MKAWVLEKQAPIGEKPLVQRDIPVPNVKDGEMLVRVHACGICRTDIHVAEGDLPLRKSPVVLGHQVVGAVETLGKGVDGFKAGDRVGIAWLNSSCGRCKFCLSGRENLCPDAAFTGWTADGGYAEYAKISQDNAYHLPDNLSFVEMAPLMCPGVTGYRALRLAEAKRGDRLGLFGFGPTASYTVLMARHLGIETYAITRSEGNKDRARALGADWVGGYDDELPVRLDAAILYPPAGDLVEVALSQLDSGGRLVLAAIHMSPIEIRDYDRNLWMERSIKSLANMTRRDAREFLQLAGEMAMRTEIEVVSFDEVPDAMVRALSGKVEGTAVIRMVE